MLHTNPCRTDQGQFSQYARRAAIVVVVIAAVLLVIDIFVHEDIVGRFGEKAWSFVAYVTFSCFILYLGFKAPVSRGVRWTLVVIVSFLFVEAGLDVTQEVVSIRQVPILGAASNLGKLLQDGLEAARFCAMFLLLYLLLKSIDDAQARYRRNMEELAEVSRRNTMGELATGLAHELNQPLAAIANYAHTASAKSKGFDCDEGKHVKRLLDKIESQACRAGDIIRRLRRTLRPTKPELGTVRLDVVVNDAADLCQVRATHLGQQISVEHAENLPSIRADAVQIQQVIVNVILNALEANASVGRPGMAVTVVTCPINDNWVEVSIADEGPGLSDDTAAKVFESFFTTKEGGLGVGLAISKSIAEVHEGRLVTRNNVEGGATFSLQLMVRGPAVPAESEQPTESDVPESIGSGRPT